MFSLGDIYMPKIRKRTVFLMHDGFPATVYKNT